MSDVPPPRASPRLPPEDDIDDTPEKGHGMLTGAYPATRAYVRHMGWVATFKAFAGFVAVVAVGAVTGWQWLLHEARAQADAGVAQLTPRVESVERSQQAVLGELRETRLDLKELYKSNRYDRKSERLEKPLPALDGGL